MPSPRRAPSAAAKPPELALLRDLRPPARPVERPTPHPRTRRTPRCARSWQPASRREAPIAPQQTIRPPAPEACDEHHGGAWPGAPAPPHARGRHRPARVVELGTPSGADSDAAPLPSMPRRLRSHVTVLPILRNRPSPKQPRSPSRLARRRHRDQTAGVTPTARFAFDRRRAPSGAPRVGDRSSPASERAACALASSSSRATAAKAPATRSAKRPTSAAPRATSSSATTATSRPVTRASRLRRGGFYLRDLGARTASTCASRSRARATPRGPSRAGAEGPESARSARVVSRPRRTGAADDRGSRFVPGRTTGAKV